MLKSVSGTVALIVLLALVLSPIPAFSSERIAPPRFAQDDVDIVIDGHIDEPLWQAIPTIDSLTVIEPDTLATPGERTLLRFFYTNRGLYVSFWCEQDPETLISRLSARDQFVSRDEVSLTIDPSGQGLYAYWFSVNLGGSIDDGTVQPERNFSRQWDGPWQGASTMHEAGWSAEMFLPWSMMAMPDPEGPTRDLGFYASRAVAHIDERWATPALPRTKGVFLSRLNTMTIEGVSPRRQLTFYPYASGNYDTLAAESSFKAGFDLFWRPSTNLQLTASINPDFGNVEADDVDVNLTAFETFFGEKRPFFLEGNEIFLTTPRAEGRGGSPITLLNTRRIGASPEYPDREDVDFDSFDLAQPSELIGATKITGQTGSLRYGVLAAAEDSTTIPGELAGTPTLVEQEGRNFGVARVLFEDTSTGARRGIGWIGTLVDHPQVDATVHGIDGHYLSANGAIAADLQFVRSDVDGVTGNGLFGDFRLTPKQGHRHSLTLDWFDDTVNFNDLGFFRRNDLVGGRYEFQLSQSDVAGVKSRRRSLATRQEFNTDGRLVRSGIFFNHRDQFDDNTRVSYSLNYFPARWDDRNSGGNGDYRIDGRFGAGLGWNSDSAKPVSLGIGLGAGQESIGGRNINGRMFLDWRPADRFSLEVGVRYTNRKGWLVHGSGIDFTTYDADDWRPSLTFDYFFTARQQFRINLQWAGINAREADRWQISAEDLVPDSRSATDSRDFTISRLVLQARYRWEIAPLSDLFVVYTRGSNLPSDPDSSLGDLLHDALHQRIVDTFVVKLRYRMGS